MKILKLNFLLFTLIAGLYILYPFSILTKVKIYYLFTLFILYCIIIISMSTGLKQLFDSISSIRNVIYLYSLFFASSLWSLYPLNTLKSIFFSTYTIGLLIIISYYFKQSGQKRIIDFYHILQCVTFSLLSAAIVLLYLYGSVRLSSAAAAGAEVIDSFSNTSAAIVEICLIYFIYFFKYDRKIPALLGICGALFIIIVSQSRGAYLITTIIFLIFIPLIMRKTIVSRILLVFKSTLFLIVLLWAVLSISPSLKHNVFNTFDRIKLTDLGFMSQSIERGDKDYGRKLQYIIALEIIKNNPILGIGYNSFQKYTYEKYNIVIVSHNIFLKIIVASGVIGLVLFIIIILKAYIISWRLKNYYLYVDRKKSEFYLTTNFALLAMLVHAQFRGLFGNMVFLLVLGMIYSHHGEFLCRQHKVKLS